MEAIRLDNGDRPEDCMLDLLGRWTSNQAGTGTLPRTWQTVVEAVKETGFGVIAEKLAHKHGVTLSQYTGGSESHTLIHFFISPTT